MTRDNKSDAVLTVGLTDGPYGPGVANGAGDIFVGACVAVGNTLQLLPDALLEGRAEENERHGEVVSCACKIFQQFVGQLIQMLVLAHLANFTSLSLESGELCFA